MQTRAGALPSLTSLRFFAAMLVVIAHIGGMSERDGVRQLLHEGRVGVSFFFVLSGFILTWAHPSEVRVATFYRKRFARIWPLHAVTWLVALAVLEYINGDIGSRLSDLRALFLVQSWTPDLGVVFAANGPSWSLSAEAFFYLCFPLTLRVCRRSSVTTQRVLLAALASTSLVVLPVIGLALDPRTADWFLYIFPPTRLVEFVLGVLLALQVMEGWRPRISVGQALALASVSLLPLAFFSQPVAITLGPFALLIAVAGAADMDGHVGVLHRPWLVRLGEWSFALYLIHNLVIAVLLHNTHLINVPGLLVSGLFVLVVSLPLSGLAHHLIELPLQRRLVGTRRPSSEVASGARL